MKQNEAKRSKIAVIASWNIIADEENDYTIAYTHYVYLRFISDKYSDVYLISSVKKRNNPQTKICYKVSDFNNVIVVPLPEVRSSLRSLFNFRSYYKAIKLTSKDVDLFYCRVPDPFSWMPRLIFSTKTIMHFVGDTIDATKHNEKWSLLKKIIMIMGYMPEYLLTLLAARTSIVYANGSHLADRLNKFGVKATAVISSTISYKSLQAPLMRENKTNSIKLIYVGYIRYAKGIKLLMMLALLLKDKYPNFIFNIIGGGEMNNELQEFVEANSLSENVILHGHIDNKDTINRLLCESDLFVFPSLSEGSPRVVIEAMSQGVPVLSTPVGSLPTAFIDRKDIRFFPFNNPDEVMSIIDEYVNNREPFIKMRDFAYKEVKEKYTLEAFLSQIFNYET